MAVSHFHVDGQTAKITLAAFFEHHVPRYYVVPDTAALFRRCCYCCSRCSCFISVWLWFVAYLSFSSSAPVSAQKMSDKTGKQDAVAPSSSAAALLNQPIVLDTGTGTTRAGFAGGTKPKVRLCVCASDSIRSRCSARGLEPAHTYYYALRTPLQPTHSSLLNLHATKHT